MMRVWIAVFTGSSKIAETIAAWIARRYVLHTASAFGGALFIKGLPWTWNIITAATVAWLITAVGIGLRLPDPTAPADQPSTEPEDEGTSESEAADPAPSSDGWTVEELAIALHAIGSPHAHISALAERLKAPTERVREALTEAHITISGGVRMAGRPVAVSTGVKSSDFPPHPTPTQKGPTEGVLTSNNNDNNNAAAFETVPDEDRPQRTHVLWRRASH